MSSQPGGRSRPYDVVLMAADVLAPGLYCLALPEPDCDEGR